MMAILNLGLGMNPALVGLLGLFPRLFDAFTDPLMGYISDNTKSRWGRRRPYLFVGAILTGLVFMVLWQLPMGKSESYYFWYFLIISFVFFFCYTVFATPWVALGYELTPDYNERTRLMGTQNFIGQLAYLVTPWVLAFTQLDLFENMVQGVAVLAVLIGFFVIGVGMMPAIFLRERLSTTLVEPGAFQKDGIPARPTGLVGNFKDFLSGFLATLKIKPFQKLCLTTLLVFNGFILISAFQTYVLIYYVFGGDKVAGGLYLGYIGTLATICTFLVIPFVAWLATKVGKRSALILALSISVVGYLLKWVCYNPDMPWLILFTPPLIAFGLGGLFTIVPSMIADVVDMDEITTYQRREGMFASIFWWVTKLGLALALGGGGFLLNATGFDVILEGAQSAETLFKLKLFDTLVPAGTTLIAIWALATYGLTKERTQEIRFELEARRGTSELAPA